MYRIYYSLLIQSYLVYLSKHLSLLKENAICIIGPHSQRLSNEIVPTVNEVGLVCHGAPDYDP